MQKEAFYLDTNVISHLADPERTDNEIRLRLAFLVQSGVIEIIGAAEIIEEFAGMASWKTEQFGRSLRLFWTLVGDKVLVGRKRLLAQEIKKGSTLARTDALLDAGTVRELRDLPLEDLDGWTEIAKRVRGQGEEFADGMHESAKNVQGAMLETVTAKEVRMNAGRFEVGERIVRDWFRSSLRSNKETWGLADDEVNWPDVGKLPCWCAFISIHLALTKKHHMARNHNYQASDQHDIDHYTSAAIAGRLVTSDRAFQSTAALIAWRPCPVIDTGEFLLRVSRM